MKKQSRKKIKNKLKKVKLLILDVDGVLTKEEIIYDDRGRELKVFNVKDGLGVYLLSLIGIKTIFLSAKNSPILKKRAKDMHVTEVRGGKLPKEKQLREIKTKYRLKKEQICFIGDDLIDLGMIEAAGVGIAVKNSCKDIKKAADYVTSRRGGDAAVREVTDLIIEAKGSKKTIREFIRNPGSAS